MSASSSLQVTTSVFATLPAPDGREVHRYDLSNGHMTVSLLDYGATLLSVKTPDREGHLEEVTLNLTTMEELLTKNMYYGSTVGRVANRIANATFSLDGKEYKLAANNGPNHLHGGLEGFDKKLWEATPLPASAEKPEDGVGVKFVLRSPDGEEGYPGNVTVEATYRLTAENVLEMDFKGTTDAPTPLALTNHAYWNLAGGLKRKAHDHTLRVAASNVLALGDHQIPTGELQPVAGTPFDLQAPEGVHLAPHLEEGKVDGGGKPGFDHCFVIDGYDPAVSKGKSEEEEKEIRSKARFMALLADPLSGRAMELKGTQPGLQVYTANWLDGPAQHQAVCLETEHFPNALNDPVLSKQNDIVLQPGETYRHFTSHRFFTFSPLPTAQA